MGTAAGRVEHRRAAAAMERRTLGILSSKWYEVAMRARLK
jgi:hypothetical protein